ncbi:hypothetical protein PAEPH01_0540 [Pancytospora epiphaga]|nr:hypothetical protein PAEPH01_0540 [Pancytospora epiphaga]
MSELTKLSESDRLLKRDILQAVQLVIDGIKQYNNSQLLRSAKYRSISNKKSKFITLKNNGRLIGFLMFRTEGHLCYIYEIHVAREWRNKGNGQLMMNRLFQLMKTHILILFVHKENLRALDFYLRNNFRLDEEYDSETYNRMICRCNM